MKDLVSGIRYDASNVISQAIGPSKEFCMGYLNPGVVGGEGYISTMKLSVGTVDVKDLDAITERIVAKDRCEKNDAYLGQVNLMKASSFCGQNGAIWGFDLAMHDDIAKRKEMPIYMQAQPEGADIPVYNIRPLLEATERLFGRAKERRFPVLPGAYVPGGSRKVVACGPVWVWSVIGLAVLKDRSKGACLFVKDAGTYGDDSTTEGEAIGFLEGILRKATNSIALCGEDQDVIYDRIYIGYKYTFVEPGQVGCALSCTPAVYMAQNAIPADMKPADLCQMTISDWEEKLGLEELTIFE